MVDWMIQVISILDEPQNVTFTAI